jgi:lysine 2,3-aminomutase
MLSQSVLLAGVNDDVNTLSKLFKLLVKNRVRPYYIHHLDKARGTARFRGTIQKGRKLMQELRGTFSGLCQPTYIIDIPGGFGKVPLTPSYTGVKEDRLTIVDPKGGIHYYSKDE